MVHGYSSRVMLRLHYKKVDPAGRHERNNDDDSGERPDPFGVLDVLIVWRRDIHEGIITFPAYPQAFYLLPNFSL